MNDEKHIARLKILSVKDNEDGTSVLTFDLDREFIEWFKDREGLKKFSQKRFEKFIQTVLKSKSNQPSDFNINGSISVE